MRLNHSQISLMQLSIRMMLPFQSINLLITQIRSLSFNEKLNSLKDKSIFET